MQYWATRMVATSPGEVANARVAKPESHPGQNAKPKANRQEPLAATSAHSLNEDSQMRLLCPRLPPLPTPRLGRAKDADLREDNWIPRRHLQYDDRTHRKTP